MTKNNFLLVDLNESKTKKIAETITSATSRKILNHLTEKEDSETSISKVLNIPISTVHYHLQKLMEAKLVKVEEFHYSPKGREVNHYKLANKYIIIAPQKTSGLREKLKGILPVGLIALGISALIKLSQFFTSSKMMGAFESSVMKTSADVTFGETAELALAEAAPRAAQTISSPPDIALWFLIGSLATIFLYLVIAMFREWWKK